MRIGGVRHTRPGKIQGVLAYGDSPNHSPTGAHAQVIIFRTHNLLTRFVTYQWPVTSPSAFGQNIMTLPAYLCPPMCEQGLIDTWP